MFYIRASSCQGYLNIGINLTFRCCFFKIKTLRLATSYISYLTRALETDDTAGGFKAELGTISRKSTSNSMQVNDCPGQSSPKSVNSVSPVFDFY